MRYTNKPKAQYRPAFTHFSHNGNNHPYSACTLQRRGRLPRLPVPQQLPYRRVQRHRHLYRHPIEQRWSVSTEVHAFSAFSSHIKNNFNFLIYISSDLFHMPTTIKPTFSFSHPYFLTAIYAITTSQTGEIFQVDAATTNRVVDVVIPFFSSAYASLFRRGM